MLRGVLTLSAFVVVFIVAFVYATFEAIRDELRQNADALRTETFRG